MRSLYQELALYPKPGLVSFRDNGAHLDMNAATFVRSLFSLRGYFVAIAAAGMRDAEFAELQQLGLAAESHMLRATRGINTHRGAIFTHGILAAAAGCAAARNIEPSDENLRAIVTDNWSRDLRAVAIARAATPSHGQLMAARHGVTGARGEALLGFPSVFEIALPALRGALAGGADRVTMRCCTPCLCCWPKPRIRMCCIAAVPQGCASSGRGPQNSCSAAACSRPDGRRKRYRCTAIVRHGTCRRAAAPTCSRRRGSCTSCKPNRYESPFMKAGQ